MPVRFLHFVVCGVLLLVQSVTFADHSKIEERYSDQRKVFLELKKLLQSGEFKGATARRDELEGYPLIEYFDYLVLRQRINKSSAPAELLDKVTKLNGDKRLQRRLLGAVKNRSVKLGRWQDYNLAWADDNAPYHPCDDLLSSFKNGHPKRFSKQTRDLWSDVDRHTRNCNTAFSMLLEELQDVPTTALWERTVALIKRGKLKSARSMLQYFNTRDGRVVKAWIDGYKNPADALRNEVIHGNSVYHQAIAKLFLSRWTRKDLPAAIEFWRTNAGRFGFNQKDTGETVAKYAVLSVKRQLPEARALLDSATEHSEARYWRVRLALRERDWQHCITTLDQLTNEEQLMPQWQYWRGRCLELQGFRSAANAIYEKIANEFEYYGFMAADKLAQGYSIKTNVPSVSSDELHKLKDDPKIIKALEYFFAGMPWEGRRQWNHGIKAYSMDKLLAAAQLADAIGWHDRALGAAYRAKATDVLEWRYPQAYKKEVTRVADHYDVPHEFVYGVMRRESRFTSDIKSPAGAVGLMQLMPATAKQMGSELGIKAPVWRLTDSKLNIRLGVRYLNFVLNRFDNNLAYAAGAYNAGPSRVKKWLADRPVDTDIWVETIPFDETRAYVKAVLFNTVVSEWVMRDGSTTRLANRMNNLSISQLE